MSLAVAAATSPPAGGAASSPGAGAASSSAANLAAAAGPTISEADFMQLLVTQLKNQDPMNPLQPYELAAQLAQFTSVQQLSQLNSQFTAQATAVNNNTQAVEAGMATSLIGRPIVATGNEVAVSSGSSTGSVIADIGGAGGRASLTLTNAQGQPIGNYALGAVSGGRQILSFPTSGLAPGAYNYTLTVTDASGNVVPTTTYVTGTVTGVDLSTSTPTLQLNNLSVPLSALVEVLPTNGAANATSPTQEILHR
jgi:flagellar basal-body rod modification protein FlgD